MEKENEETKNRIIRDIINLFEHEEEEDYYKPVIVGNLWSNNYTKYESNGDRNKKSSIEEYLNKIKPYLKDIINDILKSNTLKIQLMIATNFMYPKDNDGESVMHSKNNNIEIMINYKADEVIGELF